MTTHSHLDSVAQTHHTLGRAHHRALRSLTLVGWAVCALTSIPAAAQARYSSATGTATLSPSIPPPVLSTQATPPADASPQPAQMSGYALQVGDLPPGVFAVRVIRQSFANNVAGQSVIIRLNDGATANATTDGEGRATFHGLPVGSQVRVRTVLDNEHLESQSVTVPSQGGVRMVLVGGVGAGTSTALDTWPAPTLDATVAVSAPQVSLADGAPGTAPLAPVLRPASLPPQRTGAADLGMVVGLVCAFVLAGAWVATRRGSTR